MIVWAEIVTAGGGQTVRICSAEDRRAARWNSQRWIPAIIDMGALTQRLFDEDGDFSQAAEAGGTSLRVALVTLLEITPALASIRWKDASCTIWAGEFSQDDSVASPANTIATRFVGTVSRFEVEAGELKLTVEPGSRDGDKKVLSLEYAGTGGAEGTADKKGQLKPWLFGAALNAEPVLIDEVNSVYQFSAYGAIRAVTALYERGSDFGASAGDHASYAALVAATIPNGRWATCLAEGLVRLGAPAAGVITGDVEGDNHGGTWRRLTGAILTRIATYHGSSSVLDSASMSAIDAFAATLPSGGNINLYLTEQTTLIELAQRLARPLNAQAGFTLLGKIAITRIAIGSPTMTLHAQGARLPLVRDMIEADTLPPYRRIIMGGSRVWRVHGFEEIASTLNLIPRGVYDDTETYREGNIVSLPTGEQFLYINPVATAGNDPPNPTYWEALAPAITYADGTPIEDLKPAEPNADVTGSSVPTLDVIPPVVFAADFTGTITGSQLPKNIPAIRRRGGSDVSSTTTWSIVEHPGITGTTPVTISSGGVVTIAATAVIAASATIRVRSVRDSVTLDTTIAVTKNSAAPPSTGSGSGTTVRDSTLGSVSGTSLSAISDEMTVKTGSAGQIQFSAPLATNAAAASPAGTFDVYGQWQYFSGGTWVGVASEVLNAAGAVVEGEAGFFYNTEGALTVSPTLTGLSANTDYQVRFAARRASASPSKSVSFTGEVSAVGS